MNAKKKPLKHLHRCFLWYSFLLLKNCYWGLFAFLKILNDKINVLDKISLFWSISIFTDRKVFSEKSALLFSFFFEQIAELIVGHEIIPFVESKEFSKLLSNLGEDSFSFDSFQNIRMLVFDGSSSSALVVDLDSIQRCPDCVLI